MTGWEINALKYDQDKTVLPCPDCGSNDVTVTEHMNRDRRSVSFKCGRCGSWGHFDGFIKKTV